MVGVPSYSPGEGAAVFPVETVDYLLKCAKGDGRYGTQFLNVFTVRDELISAF